MKSSVQIDDHLFEVEFSMFGSEKYFIDGQLIDKRWNLYFSGKREFKVGNHDVKIEVCSKPKNYHCRLLIDNTIHTEQLFPEIDEKMKAYVERRNNTKPAIKALKIFIIYLVATAVAVTIYNNV